MSSQNPFSLLSLPAERPRGPAVLYAVPLAALVAAVLLRYLLDPWMGDTLPLVTLFGAVAASVWIGGTNPAIVVVILGYVACAYLFIPPRGEFAIGGVPGLIGLCAYLFTCTFIIGFGEAARRAHRDATARRELLRVTLLSIGDAVITTDVEARVTSMNTVAETLTGWTASAALGRPLDDVFRIVKEDTRQPVPNPALEAVRQGVVVGLANHTLLLCKDGSECAIDDSTAPIRDDRGDVTGCVLIFRDVSEQRRVERRKADQLLTARLLASIIESSDDAIISKSLDGVIQTWNAGAERLFGHTAAAAIGRHISLVIPAERIAEEDRIIASLKAGERIEHFETERVRADGSLIQVSLTISPIKDDAGNVVGASKIVRDVSDRKRAEASLRRLALDLSEADRRKNEFLAMLAHELRNPLAPISNASRVLRSGGRDSAAVKSASEMLERQVAQMSRLVDDLLDLSRITRGKIELRTQRIELAPVIQQAVEAVRAQYTCMNHELSVALPPHAAPRRRRSRAPGAGGEQPPEQRVQVHRQWRPGLAHRRGRTRPGRHPRARHRHRHRPRAPAAAVRDVRAGRYVAGAFARRSRHRPDAREDAGRPARRQRRGAERRRRPWQRRSPFACRSRSRRTRRRHSPRSRSRPRRSPAGS